MLTCKYLTFDKFLKTYIGRIKDNFSNFKVNFRTLIIIVGSGLKHSFVEKCQSRLDRFQICSSVFFWLQFLLTILIIKRLSGAPLECTWPF